MRIANRRSAVGELAIEDRDLFVEHFAGSAGHVDRDFCAVETDAAHGNRDQTTLILDDGLHMAPGRLDGELRAPDQPLIPEETREDAQPVAGLLSLGAIRIEDAQPKLALL